MVEIKTHIRPSILVEEISWIIFFNFFANFQELCEMRHGLLTGVCLNIKQSNRGLQTAGRLHSRQKLQPRPRPVGESPLLFFSSSTLEQLCKALLCIDSLHLHHGGLSTLALFFHRVHAEMDKCWITKLQVIIFLFPFLDVELFMPWKMGYMEMETVFGFQLHTSPG